jgi:hypothetical protein
MPPILLTTKILFFCEDFSENSFASFMIRPRARMAQLVSIPNAGSVLLPVRNRGFFGVWLAYWERFEIGS